MISFFENEYIRNILFTFQLFGDFPHVLLLLIPILIPLRLENILCMISVVLNLRLFLQFSTWSTPENVHVCLKRM